MENAKTIRVADGRDVELTELTLLSGAELLGIEHMFNKDRIETLDPLGATEVETEDGELRGLVSGDEITMKITVS